MYTATLAPVGQGILLAGATPPRGHRDFELYIVTPRVITTLEQLSKMDDVTAEDVNDAIEYMPGRIRRQLWAEQAKILLE